MIVGIDPGMSGAATFMEDEGTIFDTVEFAKHSPHEIADIFLEYFSGTQKAWIEHVASRPGQGVKSMFSFGMNYGFWLGLLTVLKIPYETVSPNVWQKAMQCTKKPGQKESKTQHKNRTKAKAQQLFPGFVITHATADSILIAEYGRRIMGHLK